MRKFLIAGNWKMNGSPKEAQQLLEGLKNQLSSIPEGIDVLVCPPSISLTTAIKTVEGTAIHVGAQNVYFEDNGAFTGEISTQMINEVGCTHVIVGHSERREHFGETDAIVNAKVKRTLSAGLQPIICVGETLDQRQEGNHQAIVKQQVDAALNKLDKEQAQKIVLAYEPIWAIGTGETATPDQAEEMHALIRENMDFLYDEETAENLRILYGGSMKPKNAKELLRQPDVDGGLIGGASLKADSFAEIIEIAEQLSNR
jgi:triosephosphate isomerase